MFTGKQFKLNRATMAIETLDGRSVAVIVPADMTVSVLSAPTNTGAMIDVLWEKRPSSCLPSMFFHSYFFHFY